uniref:Conotoxin superfamily I2 n=1 Tax=Conus ermineus TaxID=55423 RepID=A0A346CJ36_CONER|nr:conotoxin precursor superfamily I2 [Conus ermineus]
MFRLTSVGCFLLAIVLLNLVVLTDACHHHEGSLCLKDGDCCGMRCCFWRCSSQCPIPWLRQVPLNLFGQR